MLKTFLNHTPNAAAFRVPSAFERIDNRVRQPTTRASIQPNLSSRNVLLALATSSRPDSISAMYHAASEKNGGFVKIDRKFSCRPLLEGKGGDVVFVYEIVEEMEAILDFHALHSRFPSLSYPQLVGAVSFLRSLALHNQKGADLDALLDSDLEQSPQFQETVVEAMSEEEAVRVLAPL